MKGEIARRVLTLKVVGTLLSLLTREMIDDDTIIN